MNSYPYDDIVSPEEVKMDTGRLEKVISAFLRQQKSGRFPGDQIVIRRRGKPRRFL
jgi:hypothetical protein